MSGSDRSRSGQQGQTVGVRKLASPVPARPLCKCHGEPMLKNGKSPPWRCGVSHRRWYKEEQARNPQLFAARSRKYREVHAAELNYRRTVDRRRKRIDSTRTLIAELEKELLNA